MGGTSRCTAWETVSRRTGREVLKPGQRAATGRESAVCEVEAGEFEVEVRASLECHRVVVRAPSLDAPGEVRVRQVPVRPCSLHGGAVVTQGSMEAAATVLVRTGDRDALRLVIEREFVGGPRGPAAVPV